MPLRSAGPEYHSAFLKVAAIGGMVGVHLAVAAAIWLSSDHEPDIELPDAAAIQFVEIAEDFVEPAPAPTEVAMTEPVQESVVEPEPEPIPEPEPEPAPEPEPVPEPEPEPVSEPEMVAPEPKPKPEPKPEPKPQPKPEPKPEPKPLPKPKPQPKPKPKQAEPAAPAAASGQAPDVAAPKAPAAPVDPDRPRFVSQVDYAGRRPVPEYPRLSVRRGETGRVVVRVLISPSGSVDQVSVRKSSGHSRLDDAALQAAKSARFKPYKENGIALPALADIPFDFVL